MFRRLLLTLVSAIALLTLIRPAHAEPAGKIKLPPGFRAELVYTVPLEAQGSWVSLTVDDKGRLLASDEGGAIYRIEPAPIGADAGKTKVDVMSVSVGKAHGLLFHKGALYVIQNGKIGSFASGLYRLKDTNNDDKFDHIEQLRVFDVEGEHGPHAVVLSPDGEHLYICAGNSRGSRCIAARWFRRIGVKTSCCRASPIREGMACRLKPPAPGSLAPIWTATISSW
jgi:hypothetical protein